MKYPIYIQKFGIDFWKIDSKTNGHFIRNFSGSNGIYCFQSNDVKEGEIELLIDAIKKANHNYKLIDEKTYLEAVKAQTKRNSMILLKIQEKLLDL